MSDTGSVADFLARFWAPIAAFGAFLLSHVRLESKFTSREDWLKSREDKLDKALDEIKAEQKSTSEKLHNLHVEMLTKLSERSDSRG